MSSRKSELNNVISGFGEVVGERPLERAGED